MIRRVESEDWERLRDVRLRALAADPDAFTETLEDARTFSEERWRERARGSERNVTYVFEREGVFDAMVTSLAGDDPDTVYLVGMWVAPTMRGTGVAHELVKCVFEWAREHGRERVVLSVEGGNARAARFYEKCGFVRLEEPPPLPYEPRPGNRFFAYPLR
ncbi:MAG: GNAT family N-acetyltransferase [Actinobacteria bacterium]|nr:GNAT family N-acetyltransferase [Actinomycetota bacterium]